MERADRRAVLAAVARLPQRQREVLALELKRAPRRLPSLRGGNSRRGPKPAARQRGLGAEEK